MSEMKQLIIETDGDKINVVKNELSRLELKAICMDLLKAIGG